MKPKINDVVFVIVDDQIHQYNVGYLGEKSFVIDGYEYYIHSEFSYDCFNITWFKSLDKAKTQLRRDFGRGIKIIEICKGSWGIKDND